MIPWWTVVLPTITLTGWAYLFGKTKERARCIGIAVDAIGRAQDRFLVVFAKDLAARLAGLRQSAARGGSDGE